MESPRTQRRGQAAKGQNMRSPAAKTEHEAREVLLGRIKLTIGVQEPLRLELLGLREQLCVMR